MTGQYYLRARYYNPVIARFTQEDTYYGDGLNLYTYCQNNPILNHDPTGHGTKENSPYSRKEQQYIDAGADPDTARLAAECYPDAKSKQDLYNKYKKQGYSAQDAKKLANREIIHGEEATKKYIKDNNVKKSGPDYTATSPRDNVNTDWRTQERLNAQRNAGAGKGNESGNKSGTDTVTYRRVQGGEGNQSSQQRVVIDSEGNVYINKKDRNLNISIDNGEHSQYYIKNNRPGADIYEFEVPKWLDDMVKEYTIPQAGYKNNPLNQGGSAPKLTDPTTPGTCIEFPAPWIEWIEEYATNGRIISGE